MRSKRSIQFTLIFIITFSIWINSYLASDYFDKSEVSQGVIHITYKGTEGKRAKVMIEKGDKKYTYNINVKGRTESFPLQLGNGTYKVKILENTTGNSYRLVTSQTVEVKLEEDNIVFLNTIQSIEWSVDMEAIKKAVNLTKGTIDLQEKAKLLYSHMVGNYAYDYKKLATLPTTYLPVIDTTFSEKRGICYDFSSLYAAMLRSQGIPSKLIKGYTPNAEGYHAWNEVYDSSKKEWIIIDTTYDLQVIKSKPKTKMIKSEKEYQKVNEY